MTECVEPGCEATVKTDSYWPRVKAWSAGWYFRKDGTAHCPAHRPEWAPPPPAPKA